MALISPKKNESYLDLTAGYGGHAKAVIGATGAPERATLIDRDPYAIAALAELKELRQARIMQESFEQALLALQQAGTSFDLILADLGISSAQIDIATRGFSLAKEGPLDMRMDPGQETSASDIVNGASEQELAEIISRYGEEPRAKTIARAIVENRPLTTTTELSELVASIVYRRGKIHPATRTFQALRIAVNDELGQLERSLPLMVELLTPGGRLAIISFHSLEDRIVKRFFKEEASAGYEARLELLNKKPILGTTEQAINPRARSARLRGVVKIKTKGAANAD